MTNTRWIANYVKPYARYAFLNILFNILSVIFSLFSLTMVVPFLNLLFDKQKLVYEKPELSIYSINGVLKHFDYFLSQIIITKGHIDALLFVCFFIIGFFFLKNLFRYLAMYAVAPIRNGVARDIREDLFKKVLVLPLSFFNEERKGDLIARMTNDVQEIEWAILSSLEAIFREPFTIITFLIALLFMSPQLTLFILILLPVTGFIIGKIGQNLKKTSDKGQKQMGVILSIIDETLSGLRIIKAFTAETFSKEKFNKINHGYGNLMIGMYRKRDLASPMSEFMGAVVMVTVIWYGGSLILTSTGTLQAATFIAYITLFSQIISPAKAFTTAYYNAQKGLASAERVRMILNASETIKEKEKAIEKKGFEKEITYQNVSFSYIDNKPVLKNINLTIAKGKTIALVGQSGGGKSTLADLLPRFYDTTDGQILIDGTPIKDMKIKDLRNLLGVVTQESILFNDTVFNNIAFGMHNATEEEVINAAKIANAHEFIVQMQHGYRSNIGDRGGKLSGGQRQRLSIARAVLKNPPILILDEATSALDTESERLVQDALIKLMQNRTSIVIAHRLSTIQHADEIIVMSKGEIVERGRHDELLEKNGAYSKLYQMQVFD